MDMHVRVAPADACNLLLGILERDDGEVQGPFFGLELCAWLLHVVEDHPTLDSSCNLAKIASVLGIDGHKDICRRRGTSKKHTWPVCVNRLDLHHATLGQGHREQGDVLLTLDGEGSSLIVHDLGHFQAKLMVCLLFTLEVWAQDGNWNDLPGSGHALGFGAGHLRRVEGLLGHGHLVEDSKEQDDQDGDGKVYKNALGIEAGKAAACNGRCFEGTPGLALGQGHMRLLLCDIGGQDTPVGHNLIHLRHVLVHLQKPQVCLLDVICIAAPAACGFSCTFLGKARADCSRQPNRQHLQMHGRNHYQIT
mmetsp:Transcript_117018/g.277952  ORF Transcript_117018/g.277952 Transcript_117018/m.277952 type:complete len:307 (+) Transcript_117018:176-1096(+)